MKLTRILWMLLFAVLLVGCGSNSVSESFTGLQGTKHDRLQAKEGQVLHVAFQSTVTQGSLEMLVVSPNNKILWKAKGGADGTLTKDISVPTDGEYDLEVRANAASGSYHLDYSLKKGNPTSVAAPNKETPISTP